MLPEAWLLFSCFICGAFVLLMSFSTLIVFVRWKYRNISGPPPSRAKTYGPAYKIFVLHKCLIIVTGSEMIKEFLTKSKYRKAKLVYSRLYGVCGTRFLGNGFVTNLNHQEWSKRRSCVNPAFHKKYLQTSMVQFNKVADRWIHRLYHDADGQTEIEMADMLGRVTLDMIGQIAFDMDIGSIENERNLFPTSLLTVLYGMDGTVRDPLYKYRLRNQSTVRDIHQAVKYIREQCKQQILTRLHNNRTPDSVYNTDILTFILKEKEVLPHLNIEDLVDDFVTVVIAGQETTANALSFLLGEIGRNTGVLNRLLKEVNQVIGKNNFISYDQIGKLEYMNQVWRETLRLYPVAPATVRELQQRTTVNGISFPANSTLIVPFYVIHRMPQYFQNPLEFNPDRFNPNNSRTFFTYMPFSLGQRSCAGQQFAQIEAKILLCKFLQNFDFTLNPSQSFEVCETTTLRPRGGTRMTITRR